jgi:hypothetical protein
MADPIITPQLLAAAGAGIGALSKPRNPLQGALLGGIAGYSGGTALGFGAPAATTTAASAAAPVTSVADTALANQIAANKAASYGGGNILAANAANTANLNAMNAAGLSFRGMAPGYESVANVANTANATPSFFEKIGMAGKNAYENTGQSLTALSATNSLLQPEPMNQAAPVPLQAGRGVKPYDFIAAMDPYRPSVIGGNQQISLLG